MHRVWLPAVTGLGLLAALGCTGPTSSWNQPQATAPVQPATETDTAVAEQRVPSVTEPENYVTAIAEEQQVAEAHRDVLDYLQGLSKSRPANEDTDSAPERGPYEPVVPRDVATSGAAATGPAGVNVGLDLNAAPPEPDAPAAPTPEKPQIQFVAVRTSLPTDEPPAAPELPTVGINVALDQAAAERNRTLDEAVEALKQYVDEHPADLDAIWRLVFLLLATDQEFELDTYLGELNQETRRTIAGTTDLIRGVRAALSDPGPAVDHALTAIDTLRSRFTRDAELLIPRVALCTRVSTFGVYDEMDVAALPAFHANRAIVYCEIKNFYSERLPNESYRVSLSSRLELLTPDGKSLWTHDEPDIEDVSRQRREDFFLAQLVTLPATLSPGEYVLKVTIEDRTAAKANEAVHKFELGTTTLSHAGR
jgi:hypothetical protein